MAYTEANRDNVKAAILTLATGERVVKVTLGGKTIEYGQSQLNDLRALLAEIEAALARQSGRPGYYVTTTSKGLYGMQAGNLKIVDHNGRPIRARASYEAASFGRRLNTWGTSTAGPDTTLFNSLSTLRSRSRELIRNDPLAGGGMDTLVANLIGTGITPRWQILDADLKKQFQERWDDWVNEADADGTCDFYGLQALAARSIIEAGEVLIRFRPRRPEKGLSVPLQLQFFEADHLDATYNTLAPNGNEIRMGIEFDKSGNRKAYWLFKADPGESFLTSGNTAERIRVPANEILHCYRPLRPGQKRGTPWLASVIITQHDINEFDDAEIVRKKGAAMFGGFITESETERFDYPPIGKPGGQDSESGGFGSPREVPDMAGILVNFSLQKRPISRFLGAKKPLFIGLFRREQNDIVFRDTSENITYRCHKRQFPLKFSKDRHVYLQWLCQARKG